MSDIELTIAICGYKNAELLRLCLASVLKEVERSRLSSEVIVIDSATEESTEVLMREEFPTLRFFPHRENVGFRVLVNTALREGRGRYFFILNSDIILAESVIIKLYTYALSHPQVGLLGPKQFNFDGTLQQTCLRFYRPLTILYRRTWFRHLPWAKRHLAWFTMQDYDHVTPKEVDWLMGSALFTSRAAVDTVGLMDNRFFMYMEDVDWSRRFWEAGYSVVYYPEATLYHYLGKGSARGGFLRSLFFNRLTWYHIASACKYFWKYRGKMLPQHTE